MHIMSVRQANCASGLVCAFDNDDDDDDATKKPIQIDCRFLRKTDKMLFVFSNGISFFFGLGSTALNTGWSQCKCHAFAICPEDQLCLHFTKFVLLCCEPKPLLLLFCFVCIFFRVCACGVCACERRVVSKWHGYENG